MALLSWVVVSCAVFSASLASDTFGNILGDVTSCEEVCTKSYSPHTNPNAKESAACNRGCRFYTISEFVQLDGPKHGNAVDGSDANPVRRSCENACVEAYNETSRSTLACKFGCESQDAKAQQEKKKTGEEETSMHLLSPLMQVRSVYSSFVGAIHIVRSSLVTYFVSDDSQIIAVESEPQIIMEVMPGAEKQPNLEETQANSRQVPLKDLNGQPRVTYLEPGSYIPKPHIVLLGVLALSFITTLLIYSICITFVPRKSKAYGEGLSIQADALGPLPIKLVRPEDLTKLSLTEEEEDDNQEAPPLPTKVMLPDTII